MRGRGRVYRPTSGYTGEAVAVWSLDYTVNGKRYRHPSGQAVKADALDALAQAIADRKNGVPVRPLAPKTLAEYVTYHLAAKGKETDRYGVPITARWVGESRHKLERAVAFFGKERVLPSIGRKDLLAWIERLRQTMSEGTARHHINALSSLYQRAVAEELVGANPVARLMAKEKPKGHAEEAKWLEVPEAALLLETAKEYHPKRDDMGMPFAYPLIATLLLTGGRLREVLGLEAEDVNMKRKTVTFRPNAWRRLKTKKSARTVRLWPQLQQILLDYWPQRRRMGAGTLLFPSFRTKHEAMLTDVRKLLDAVAKQAGWKKGEITPKMFRQDRKSVV